MVAFGWPRCHRPHRVVGHTGKPARFSTNSTFPDGTQVNTDMKMNWKLTAALLLFVSPFAFAAEGHPAAAGDKEHADHEEVEKGSGGGQLVRSKAGFNFEVGIDKDRKAKITFLDADLKPVEPGERTVTGIAGQRSAPVKLKFVKGEGGNAGALVSDQALPPGAHVQMILTIKPGPDAKAVTERFELHLH